MYGQESTSVFLGTQVERESEGDIYGKEGSRWGETSQRLMVKAP